MVRSDAPAVTRGGDRRGPPRSTGGSYTHRPTLNHGGGAESPPLRCRAKGKLFDQSVYPYNQGRACCTWVSRSRWPANALTAGRPPSDGQLGEAGPERARDTHRGGCRLVTGRVRRRPCQARHGCIYICNICGVQPIVADTSPVRKPPDGVDATMRLRSREARWG